MVMAAVAVGSLAVSAYSASQQSGAAKDAAQAQRESAQEGIGEQRYRFDAMQKLLEPYVNGGNRSIAAQQDLLGLNGTTAQQNAIGGIQASPMFGAMAKQGEDAILQNASATGGLRGGNTQGALAQFRPQLLNQLIDQQYQRLGGLTSIGQNAAAGTGNAGMQTGNNIAQLFGQQGAASAGQALGVARANAQFGNSVASTFGNYVGMGGFGNGSGAGGSTPPPPDLF
jgi:hypothetical protein